MPPEQALGQTLSEVSDWYAVGVMLYQVLCGQLPIDGRNANELLRRKLDRDPVPLSSLSSAVPARLEDLSGGGACFAAAPESWQAGSQVNFSLGVEGRPNLLQARGVVRWRDGGLVGIAFESTGPIHRQQVEEVVRTLAR